MNNNKKFKTAIIYRKELNNVVVFNNETNINVAVSVKTNKASIFALAKCTCHEYC